MKITDEELTEKEQRLFGEMLRSPIQIWSDIEEEVLHGNVGMLQWRGELTSIITSLVEKGWVSITELNGIPVKYQFPENTKTRFLQLYIEKKTTPEEFAIEMQKIEGTFDGDTYGGHIEADELLVKVLRQQGFKKGCGIFEKMGKWYS